MIARRDMAVRVAARTDLSPMCFRVILETSEEIDPVPGQFGMQAGGFTEGYGHHGTPPFVRARIITQRRVQPAPEERNLS